MEEMRTLDGTSLRIHNHVATQPPCHATKDHNGASVWSAGGASTADATAAACVVIGTAVAGEGRASAATEGPRLAVSVCCGLVLGQTSAKLPRNEQRQSRKAKERE